MMPISKHQRNGCGTIVLIFIVFLGIIIFGYSSRSNGQSGSSVSTTSAPARTSTPQITASKTIHPTVSLMPSVTPQPTYSLLSIGSSGEEVRQLQIRLNQLGFSVGVIDGSYGAKTEYAVKAFQKSAHLTSDGIAGNATLSALYSSSAPSAPSSYIPYSGSSNSSSGNDSNFNKYNEKVSSNYVGNSNTGKFHRASCSSAQKISPSNRVSFDSRDDALSAGYVACKRCNP